MKRRLDGGSRIRGLSISVIAAIAAALPLASLASLAGKLTAFDCPGAYLIYPTATASGLVTGECDDVDYHAHGFVRDAAGNFTSFDILGPTPGGLQYADPARRARCGPHPAHGHQLGGRGRRNA